MKYRIIILIFLLSRSFSGISQAGSLTADSLAQSQVESIVSEYLELFPISYAGGVYHVIYENRFRNLFEEEARIVNFFPETPGYLSELSVDNYISLVKGILENKIIQLSLWESEILRTEKLQGADANQTHVQVSKKIAIYKKDEEHIGPLEAEFEVELIIIVNSFPSKNEHRISQVKRKQMSLVDLNFRVLHTGREPAARLPFEFTYFDGDQKVIRKRYSDNEGRLVISVIPEQALIRLTPPDGYRFIFTDNKTAGAWKTVPEQERFLFIKEKPAFIKPRGLFFLELGYYQPLSTFTNSMLENAVITSFEENGAIQSGGKDFKLNLSFYFLKKQNFAVSVGAGVEKKELWLENSFTSLDQEFSGMLDADQDTFQLRILGRDVFERYDFAITSLPVFLTFHYPLGSKFLNEISFRSGFIYSLAEKITFTSELQQTTTGYYSAYDLMLSDLPAYYFETRLLTSEESINGETTGTSKTSFVFGLGLTFNVFRNLLFATYNIDYQSFGLGKGSEDYFLSYEERPGYFLHPSLITTQRKVGQFNMGLGLRVMF
jgi:hypothetical protein